MFADELPFLVKQDVVLPFLIVIGFIFTIFSALWRISAFGLICFPQRYVEYHPWPFAICSEWTLKDFMNISLYNSILGLKTVFAIHYSALSLAGCYFIFLKWDGSIWDLAGKFRHKRMHLFGVFWIWFTNLSLKQKTMGNIRSWIVAELEHCIIVSEIQDLGTFFVNTVILVWHLFFLGLLKPSLIHLIHLLFRVA